MDGKAGRVWLFGWFLTLPQRPRQCPLERHGALSHPTSARPQHCECSRLKPPGLDGSPSSKIAVSRSFSLPLVFVSRGGHSGLSVSAFMAGSVATEERLDSLV